MRTGLVIAQKPQRITLNGFSITLTNTSLSLERPVCMKTPFQLDLRVKRCSSELHVKQLNMTSIKIWVWCFKNMTYMWVMRGSWLSVIRWTDSNWDIRCFLKECVRAILIRVACHVWLALTGSWASCCEACSLTSWRYHRVWDRWPDGMLQIQKLLI